MGRIGPSLGPDPGRGPPFRDASSRGPGCRRDERGQGLCTQWSRTRDGRWFGGSLSYGLQPTEVEHLFAAQVVKALSTKRIQFLTLQQNVKH